jgi:uncharacterized protein YndB with AHSA1/START domain
MTDALQQLRMTRAFDATRERLFDAWTTPDIAGQWLMTTPGSEAHGAEFDLRVGGRWVITDRREGVDYQAVGEYLEVLRPDRLSFTFGMPQFSPAFNKVTVEIVAQGAGCVMTLTQEDLPPEHIPALEEGWGEMFDALAGCLAG